MQKDPTAAELGALEREETAPMAMAYSAGAGGAGASGSREAADVPACPDGHVPWVVRQYSAVDHPAVGSLYAAGLLLGRVDPWDTASDLDYMEEAYFSNPRDTFLVAEVGSSVVGMVGVVEDEAEVAHIRRLRVDPAWQDSDLTRHLIEAVLEHCRQMGFLKVVFDTHMDPTAATALISNCGFQQARQRNVHGKVVLEFYLNIYVRPAEC